jgi:hypothetical protein
MAEPRDDRSEARREAAVLLGVDIEHLSAADGLRVDMVSALRLVIDHEQSCVLSGGSADLGKLNVAVQSLIALLPGRELPAPESQREDPRQIMFEIYMKMRRNGEINLRNPDEGPLQSKIHELEAEVAALKAGSAPALLDSSTAIDPPLSDIVPPSERAECDPGPQRGPDDPPRRTPLVIDGKAEPNPPAASAPAKPAARPPQNWDDSDSGRAWQAWHDAGGSVGGDRWSNRNIP